LRQESRVMSDKNVRKRCRCLTRNPGHRASGRSTRGARGERRDGLVVTKSGSRNSTRSVEILFRFARGAEGAAGTRLGERRDLFASLGAEGASGNSIRSVEILFRFASGAGRRLELDAERRDTLSLTLGGLRGRRELDSELEISFAFASGLEGVWNSTRSVREILFRFARGLWGVGEPSTRSVEILFRFARTEGRAGWELDFGGGEILFRFARGAERTVGNSTRERRDYSFVRSGAVGPELDSEPFEIYSRLRSGLEGGGTPTRRRRDYSFRFASGLEKDAGTRLGASKYSLRFARWAEGASGNSTRSVEILFASLGG